MNVSGPRDLPELRLHLLSQWRKDGPFEAVHGSSYDSRFARDLRFNHLEPPLEVDTLRRAELWWVTPGMSRLVDRSAASLPATTLTDDLCPDRPVLAFFAEPLLGSDAVEPGHQLKVNMLMWEPKALIWDQDQLYVTVSMYGPVPFEPSNVLGMTWYPMGRTDWKFGTDTEEPTFKPNPDDADALRAASMAQDRRWLAALLLLASQPLAESTILRQTNKSKKRRLEKAGHTSDVRLVNLRSAKRSGGERSGETRPVERTHRWIVGEDTGGFWKQVAYGPQHSLRRPKWIFPYIQGPADKPLKVRETVKVLREDRLP